jgi:hypothetical protein
MKTIKELYGISEEHGAGDAGTSALVAKYKNATPGQSDTSKVKQRQQAARRGDKLNTVSEESSYRVEVEGLPTMYINSKSPTEVKANLRRLLKKADQIKSVDRVPESEVRKAFRLKSQGKETEQTVDENYQDPELEKTEMAQTQLHFIAYAAEEILDYIEMGGMIEEWYQNKLSKSHSDMEGLHSYIEGEKRRLGLDEGYNTTETIDEAAAKKMKGEDPCWKDYEMIGTKNKGGKQVPNCVPKTNEASTMLKNVKRMLKGTDAYSRAKEEGGKMVAASDSGDSKAALKHATRVRRLSSLDKNEGLDPSMGAGEYVKDFRKSDAPQFKGKSKEERQKMAVAAFLSAKNNK